MNVKLHSEFIRAPKFQLISDDTNEYMISIMEKMGNEINVVYDSIALKNGEWFQIFREWYTQFYIKLYGWNGELILIDTYEYDDKNKNVQINLYPNNIDEIKIWYKYLIEYKNIHNCNLFIYSDKYIDILMNLDQNLYISDFIKNESDIVDDCYALYDVGRFDINENSINKYGYFDIFGGKIKEGVRLYDSFKNPRDWKYLSSDDIICDILGISNIYMDPFKIY